MAAGELARRCRRTKVVANVLYVDNGQVPTSAGAAAGMDLCLHIVRRDHGALGARPRSSSHGDTPGALRGPGQ
jgi:transcriptional regulator GlxA family with amidase domain